MYHEWGILIIHLIYYIYLLGYVYQAYLKKS